MLYKRENGKWYAEFVVDGQRIRRSTRTTNERIATKLYNSWKSELEADGEVTPFRAGEVVSSIKRAATTTHQWDHAVVAWFGDEKVKAKRSIKSDLALAKALHPYLNGVALADIDYIMLEGIQKIFKKRKLQDATVDQHLSFVRRVLRRVSKKERWIQTVPAIPMFNSDNSIVRYLTTDEETRLYAALPESLKAPFLIAVHTGMRTQEIRELRWSWIDFENRHVTIPKEISKNKHDMRKPLNQTALNTILSLRGNHRDFVISYGGKRWKDSFSTRAWYAALKKAGIENFRFHDLRHTWASRLRQKGVPLDVLQELGGWKSPLMVQRYGHLDVEHLHDYAALLDEDRQAESEKVVYLTRKPAKAS